MARYASGNNEPLTHWNSHPVYLTTILTGVFVAGLLLSAVLAALHSGLVEWLIFAMPLVPSWSVWRAATYILVSPINFFTPFSILCFYWWSMGIETHLGRKVLAQLLTFLLLAGPAVGIGWYLLGSSSVWAGNYAFTCGLLVAFATLYPNVEAWGWVPFKWIAFACIVSGSLMELAARDWLALSEMWVACAVGFAYIRQAREMEYDDARPLSAIIAQWFRRKPKLRVLPSPDAPARREETGPMLEMDALLDKIAKSGMNSLSAKERARLQQAREALLKRERS